MEQITPFDPPRFIGILRHLEAHYPEDHRTLELFDRIRCSRCPGRVDAPKPQDAEAHAKFWAGRCPACEEPWFVLR